MTQVSSSQDNPALALDERSALSVRLSDHLTLTKPGITAMVVITAFIGFAMGAVDASWSPVALLAALVGTGLSCMGASVYNQVYERDTDALMRRTQDRPLPAGRLSVGEAIVAGTLFSVLGVGVLWTGANGLAAALSAFTIFSYCLIYTPMKRVSSASTIVGAVPGAMPPVIGYAAVTGRVGIEAVLLFLIMFVWQLPHFYAIGYLYREDYARARLPILPVIDATGRRTFRQILITSVALLIVGVLPALVGGGGVFTLLAGAVCGGAFLALAIKLVLTGTRNQARALFLASLVYLPVVLTVVLLDHLF